MKIKGAIFDMDGTIVDSLMFWDYLWKRIGEEYMNDSTFRPSEEVDKKVRTMIFVDAMTYFREYYSLDVKVEDFIRFTGGGINDFYKNIATVKAGAREYLDYLKNNNVKMCLASATAMPEIKYALECHDLLKYFDLILSCADIGVGKDKPDIYVKAMTEMNISCDELCVFEDSFVALETAKSVGFNTVGIYDKYNFEQERLKAASDIYLGDGKRLDSLIRVIEIS